MKKSISFSLLTILLMPMFANANYLQQTNYLALKQGQEWSWEKLAKIPNAEWLNKKPKFYADTYYMHGYVKDATIHIDSPKKDKPMGINIVLTYHSTDRNSKNIYKLQNFFNTAELKEVKSNCTRKDEYQHFYEWRKKGHKTLYIAMRKFFSSDGHIDHNHIIVQDFHHFNLLTGDGAIMLNRYDNNDNEITCRLL